MASTQEMQRRAKAKRLQAKNGSSSTTSTINGFEFIDRFCNDIQDEAIRKDWTEGYEAQKEAGKHIAGLSQSLRVKLLRRNMTSSFNHFLRQKERLEMELCSKYSVTHNKLLGPDGESLIVTFSGEDQRRIGVMDLAAGHLCADVQYRYS